MTCTRFTKLLVAALFALVAVAGTSCSTTSNTSSSDDQPAIAATVHIKDGEFDPRETDIEVGGSVMWINDDVSSHDLKFVAPNTLTSGVLKPAASWVHTFSAAGTYDYYCDFHNTMKGSVVVQPTP